MKFKLLKFGGKIEKLEKARELSGIEKEEFAGWEAGGGKWTEVELWGGERGVGKGKEVRIEGCGRGLGTVKGRYT